MDKISWVAWWGAVLSSIVFAWDIYKWARKGPRVKVLTRCHVSYSDARVVSTQQTEHGTSTELADYCHIEIANLGETATTVISLEAMHDRKKTEPQASVSGSAFQQHHGKVLPAVLAPGGMWSGRIEMGNISFLAKRGRPYIAVRCSHKDQPIRAYPKH